jgi:titin
MAGAGNTIASNGGSGVYITGTGSNSVQANAIGGPGLGNSFHGVVVIASQGHTLIGTDGDGINDPAERNVISGNTGDGVFIGSSSGVVVAGNYIGTDAAGQTKLPNSSHGVEVLRSQGNRIGTQSGDADAAGERNVISGNALDGVAIGGLDSRNNVVAGNFIGTDAGGQAPLPNGRLGVALFGGANGNTIGGPNPGDGNVISGNTGDGLLIRGNGLPAGAVADYRAEGNAEDALFFNPGTLQGNVTFEPGRFGQAFHFDGATGEGVNIPASPSLNVGAGGGLTLTAWINPDDVSSQEPIIEWTNGVHLWFSVTFGGAQGPGNLYANLPDTNGIGHVISSAPNLIQPHQWQFVALTYDQASGVATLYLNGEVVRQLTLGIFTPNTTGDVNLGHRVPGSFSGSGQFAGGMDEVGIYNQALSIGDIGSLATVNGIGRNSVLGNRIGTALDPRVQIANGGDGVVLDNTSYNEVGLTTALVPNPNVIAGNLGRGLVITGSDSTFNGVAGNFIGTDVTGTVHQGNGSDGMRISEGANYTFVYGGNLIAYNRGHGVVVGNGLNDPSAGNFITGDRIWGNSGIGIDLGNDGVTPNVGPVAGDANGLANFPVLGSAQAAGSVTLVTATVHGSPSSLVSIDFYADPSPDSTGYGQGQTLLGTLFNVPTNGAGNATVTDTFPVNLFGQVVTATATYAGLGTSEFALDVAVTPLMPTLTSLGSSTTTEGAQTLNVNGTNFAQGAVVSVNGTPLATTFVNSTQLRAAIPAGLLEEGMASVTVANPAPGGGTSNALALTVTDAPLTVTGSPFYTGVVATFTDTGGSEPAGNYTALITWGDGSTSPGTVVPTSTGFNVLANHTYLSSGVYTTTVTVSDEGGSSASATGSVAVGHAPLTAWGASAALTEGTSGPAVMAYFSDPDPRDAGSDFTATITWGDGSTSAGAVSPAADGLFQVTGAHAYAEEGSYLASVSIQDDRGGSASASTTVRVADSPLAAVPVTLTVTGNKNFSGIVGYFRDAAPAAAAGDYTATVTWDDGTISAARVSGSGTFVVAAAHRFGAFKGPHTVVVTVTDAGGASVTFTDTVIDPPARHHGRHRHGHGRPAPRRAELGRLPQGGPARPA